MDKSSYIRELLHENPGKSPAEIQRQLSNRGIEVTRNLAKVVCHRERSKNDGKEQAERKARKDETKFGSVVYRLSKEDKLIWQWLLNWARGMQGRSIKRYQTFPNHAYDHAPVSRWLFLPTTRRARRRRRELLKEFIQELVRRFPEEYQPTRKDKVLSERRTEKLAKKIMKPLRGEPSYDNPETIVYLSGLTTRQKKKKAMQKINRLISFGIEASLERFLDSDLSKKDIKDVINDLLNNTAPVTIEDVKGNPLLKDLWKIAAALEYPGVSMTDIKDAILKVRTTRNLERLGRPIGLRRRRKRNLPKEKEPVLELLDDDDDDDLPMKPASVEEIRAKQRQDAEASASKRRTARHAKRSDK